MIRIRLTVGAINLFFFVDLVLSRLVLVVTVDVTYYRFARGLLVFYIPIQTEHSVFAQMEYMMHGAISIHRQSPEDSEHAQANPKQFSLYSYTGNIADYDDDEIFCSIDIDKADDLIRGILDHPFLESKSGRPSKRRRFDNYVRKKAIRSGMDRSTTEALLLYVDKLYTERRKLFSLNKEVAQDERYKQGPSSKEEISTEKDNKRKRENTRTVDDGPVKKRKHVRINPFPVEISQRHEMPLDVPKDGPAPRLPNSPAGHRSRPLTARDTGDGQSTPVSNNHSGPPSSFSDKDSSSRRTEKNRRKRAARKARRAQRRASRDVQETALPPQLKEPPLRTGQNSTREEFQDNKLDYALSSPVGYIAHPDSWDIADDAASSFEDEAFWDNSGFQTPMIRKA